MAPNVVLAVDVQLQQHQQAVEPLAVLERVAPGVERRGNRPGELLQGRGGEWHVHRALGGPTPAGELHFDDRVGDRDPAIEALVLGGPCGANEGAPEGGAGKRALGAGAELLQLLAGAVSYLLGEQTLKRMLKVPLALMKLGVGPAASIARSIPPWASQTILFGSPGSEPRKALQLAGCALVNASARQSLGLPAR